MLQYSRTDTAMTLEAQKPTGQFSSFGVSVIPTPGATPVTSQSGDKLQISLSGLIPGTMYTVTIWSISGTEKSTDQVKSFYSSRS